MKKKNLLAILIVFISVIAVAMVVIVQYDWIGKPTKPNITAWEDKEYPLKEINKGEWHKLTNLTAFIHSLKHASERKHELPYLQQKYSNETNWGNTTLNR